MAQQLGFYLAGTAPVELRAIPASELSAAQRQAVRYAARHPHEILAEAGHFALRGVVDITSTGVRIAVGIVWG